MWGYKWKYDCKYTTILNKEEIEMIIFAMEVSDLEGQNTENTNKLIELFKQLLKNDAIPAPDEPKGQPYLYSDFINIAPGIPAIKFKFK